MDRVFLSFVFLACLAPLAIEGHGYLLKPPARGTAWRVGFKTPTDTNDMGNYCGGRGTQHNQNGGLCAVCGENYASTAKKLEPGPANVYATGTILGDYTQGDVIDVTIMITAFHKGYYEFRLCDNNVPQKGKDASIAVTNDCLNQNLLTTADGQSTQFVATPGKSVHRVKLPNQVTCTACVFQWRYRTGNNWGCENDKCGSGLGPQEEFVGCSDIAIHPSDGPGAVEETTPTTTPAATTVATTTLKPTTPEPTTPEPTTPEPTTPEPTTPEPTTPEPTTQKPTTPEPTTPEPTTPEPTTQKPTTQKPTTQKPTTQKPTTQKPTTRKPTTVKKVTPKPTKPVIIPAKPQPPKKSGRKVCRGKGVFGASMDHYCNINCNHVTPYCPPSHCSCN